MTKLLLTQYRLEYETDPDITIEQLVEKYNLKLEDLKGYEEWAKPHDNNPYHTHNDIVPYEHTSLVPPSKDLEGDIKTFKEKAIAHCLAFIEKDARFAEVKEFKDIVSIVDSIDKSLKGTNDGGPTINVLVQNIAERFVDDC